MRGCKTHKSKHMCLYVCKILRFLDCLVLSFGEVFIAHEGEETEQPTLRSVHMTSPFFFKTDDNKIEISNSNVYDQFKQSKCMINSNYRLI